MPQLSYVLLDDDDPTTNFLNQLLLKNMAVAGRCLVAENGAQALALLDSACATPSPVLVLLDVNMPVLGGIAFLEAYRQLPAAQRMAVVVLTTTLHPLRPGPPPGAAHRWAHQQAPYPAQDGRATGATLLKNGC